jgi:hypothetical protein
LVFLSTFFVAEQPLGADRTLTAVHNAKMSSLAAAAAAGPGDTAAVEDAAAAAQL